MAKKGELSRRSFLARVAGGIAATGALSAVTGCASSPRETGLSDADLGPQADPAGQGRGPRNGAGPGIRDNDSGPNGDAAACCRGGASGLTDNDTCAGGDPDGNGRGASGSR